MESCHFMRTKNLLTIHIIFLKLFWKIISFQSSVLFYSTSDFTHKNFPKKLAKFIKVGQVHFLKLLNFFLFISHIMKLLNFALISAISAKISFENLTEGQIQIVNEALQDAEVVAKLQANNPVLLEEEAVAENSNSTDAADPRSLTNLAGKYKAEKVLFRVLSQYGCWCTFDSDFPGMGIPMDKFDRKCKLLNEAYECASEEINKCRPWSVKYKVPARAYALADENEVRNKCERLNRGSSACVITACSIQVQFIIDIFDLLSTKAPFSMRYRHDRGFKPQKDCQVHNRHYDVDRKCCGSYPRRKVYNSVMQECCNDGIPRMVC